MNPGGLLLEILEDWGVDHQGVVNIPYSRLWAARYGNRLEGRFYGAEAAEAVSKCGDDSKFLFGLEGVGFACDWMDTRPNAWERSPFQIMVFMVDLTDPDSLDLAKKQFFVYRDHQINLQ